MNPQFAAGHVHEDLNSGQRVYVELHKDGFDRRHIMASGTGIAITPEQYAEQWNRASLSVNIANAKRFLRVALQVKDKTSS
jgi:hypothetical protein